MLVSLLALVAIPAALGQNCSKTPVPVFLDKFSGSKTLNLFKGTIASHNMTVVSGYGKLVLSKPTGNPNYYMSKLTDAKVGGCFDSPRLLSFASEVLSHYKVQLIVGFPYGQTIGCATSRHSTVYYPV